MATPDDGYPPDVPTRLVGDGRIAVRVPAVWPRASTSWVSRSSVVVESGVAVPLVVFDLWPPPGTVAVHVEPGASAARPPDDDGRLGSVDVVVPQVLVSDDTDLESRPVTALTIRADGVEGVIRVQGDDHLARTVAATAHVLPPSLTVVPHPFRGPAPGMYRRHSLAEVVTSRMERAGLHVILHHEADELEPSEQCDPLWGEVVPTGSEVHVILTPADERDRRS